ncbi:class I SAM-dependent methyltransferase [Gordonia humi]|uniref:class I SAM-dependent methyltransferase n=1 Tax=Gordonia humi TaxID=686429 RepID=UPI003619B657
MLGAVPAGARSALDVGTGDGLLAGELAQRVPEVTAIDIDRDVVSSARAEFDAVDFVVGDVMSPEFGGQFDLVASMAAVHHLGDPSAALRRLADLTSPGGTLVVVGLARPTGWSDYAMDAVGVVQHKWLSWRRGPVGAFRAHCLAARAFVPTGTSIRTARAAGSLVAQAPAVQILTGRAEAVSEARS